jgi:enoyl-CoA hydratase/carnithine racemase
MTVQASPSTPQTRHLEIGVNGAVATLRLNRPEKRNAVNNQLINEIGDFFFHPPAGVKVAILHAAGNHFCAGLDLSTMLEKVDPMGAIETSRLWHRILHQMQYGGLVVVVVMHGAVLGGGLEIATAAHVRIAEESAFFGLPEARRGIFVGGGATVRVGKVIGSGRMTEMMLTGRTYTAQEAFQFGLVQHVVPAGTGMARAGEIAEVISGNSSLTNYLAIQVIPRIETMGNEEGFLTESLAAALPRFSQDSTAGVSAFLEKRRERFE